MVIKTDGNGTNYRLVEGETVIATLDSFTTAAIVCRFIRGARLEKPEYDTAIKAMQDYDKQHTAQAD